MNFKIVEGGYNEDEIYSQFKEEYLKGDKKVSEIVDDLGLTKYMYMKFRKRVTLETGFRRPRRIPKANPIVDKDRYIYLTPQGNHLIQKRLNGKTHNCGTYKTKEIAVTVRTILEEHEWDLSIVPSLKEKYMGMGA